MRDVGQASSIAYFYFDFRDIKKQDWRDLVPFPSHPIPPQINRVPVATFYHVFILVMAMARNSPMMTL